MPVEIHPEEAQISRLARSLKDKPGALLPILHAVQEELGYLPAEAVPILAKELNLTRAEIHGVVSFYHDFRSSPPGRHVVRICQAESCRAMGSTRLTAFAREHLGIDFHETTADRAFTLEPVYCLGICAASPSMTVDGEIYGRLTSERLQQILEQARQSQ